MTDDPLSDEDERAVQLMVGRIVGKAPPNASNLPPELTRYLARLATKFAGMNNPVAIQLVLEYSAPSIVRLYKEP